MSSSLGRDVFLMDAIRVLDIVRHTWSFLLMYTTAPYALVLASANTNMLLIVPDWLGGKYVLGISSCGNSFKSVRITVHVSLVESGSGSSHVNLVCQISCSKILALIVTGVAQPNGSKICDESCSMSHLVTKILVAGKCLFTRKRVSVAVFQRRPRSPMVVFGLLVLSLFVISWR